jgi:hypothetical protein
MAIDQMVDYNSCWKAYSGLEVEEKDASTLRTIICTIDKDLRMVPGWHYSWPVGDRIGEREPYFVSELGELQPKYHTDKFLKNGDPKLKKLEGTGLTWFYCQLITGDSTDNIPGCPGAGPGKALEALHGLSNEEEMYQATLALYEAKYAQEATTAFSEHTSIGGGVDHNGTLVNYQLDSYITEWAKKELLEQAYLLWMVRELDKDGKPIMWEAPTGELPDG